MVILTNFDSFAITYLIWAGCFKNVIFQCRLCSSQQTWKGFAGTLRENKKDYIMDSYKKTCKTLFIFLFRAIAF